MDHDPQSAPRSRRDLTPGPRRPRRARFDDDDEGGYAPAPASASAPAPASARRRPGPEPALPEPGPTPSSWPGAVHGPRPRPSWVITEGAAVDTELGVLKTGKEADVHLVERALPGTGRAVLLAAKRYRDSDHRMFHRDAGYLEGRRVRRSRETRAMARRTDFGRDLISVQWASAEFGALARLWELGRSGGIRVPYPVQLSGTELLLEFIGDPDGTAAPRLAQLHPGRDQLAALWEQVLEALGVLALAGYAHADLSPYNLLVHHGRLVLIDLPQVVDVVGNPNGPALLARDVRVMARWFAARGLDPVRADPEPLLAALLSDAGLSAAGLSTAERSPAASSDAGPPELGPRP